MGQAIGKRAGELMNHARLLQAHRFEDSSCNDADEAYKKSPPKQSRCAHGSVTTIKSCDKAIPARFDRCAVTTEQPRLYLSLKLTQYTKCRVQPEECNHRQINAIAQAKEHTIHNKDDERIKPCQTLLVV
eukprot:scaffold282101_cov35-Tisochrysis_lutea.AAC.1